MGGIAGIWRPPCDDTRVTSSITGLSWGYGDYVEGEVEGVGAWRFRCHALPFFSTLVYIVCIVYTFPMDEPQHMGIRDFRTEVTERVEAAHFREEPTVVTKNGRPRAVLVPVDWYEKAVEALNNEK